MVICCRETLCVSVHGANRLGANSLLDLVVFGRAYGKNIVEKHKTEKENKINPDTTLMDKSLEEIDNLLTQTEGQANVGDMRTKWQIVETCLLYKSQDLLETGYEKIKNLHNQQIKILDNSWIWNTDLIEALELRNMIDLADVTIGASLFREESRGSHFRNDFPERNDEDWMYHTLSYLDTQTKEVTHMKAPVNFEGLYPEEMESVPAIKVY